MVSTEVVVGRQPIFDRDLYIAAYQLLFRSGSDAAEADPTGDADTMTASVLSGALSIGLDRLVGDKAIFCNAGPGVLTGAVPLLLPPDRTTVEVGGVTSPVPEIVDGCARLRGAGYRISLGVTGWFDGVERLLMLASAVRLDAARLGTEAAIELGARCAEFGVERLAHKIETTAEFDLFEAAGFELFQGYALARPMVLRGAGLDASTLGVLQMASTVLHGATDIGQVERIIRRDPGLTLQLLEIASIGPMGGTRRTVRSIRDALVLIGTERLRSWVLLLMLRQSRPMPSDELVTVLTRARMCELLAGEDQAAFAFAAGMVSALDRLLGVPAAELTGSLPLDPELLAAAFADAGTVGAIVRDVIDFESAAGVTGDAADAADPILRALTDAFREALRWAVESAELLEIKV